VDGRFAPIYDTFVKIDDAWFFAERLLYVDWIDERPLP